MGRGNRKAKQKSELPKFCVKILIERNASSDGHNREWVEHKKTGNTLFSQSKYLDAAEEYSTAIEKLEKEIRSNVTKDQKTCLSKLYGRRSAAYHACFTELGKPEHRGLCERALADGQTALQLHPSYAKGHYRCAVAHLSLGERSLAVDHILSLVSLLEGEGKSFHEDASLVRLMTDCRFMAAIKDRSPDWQQVKFKDNCVVVDQSGLGDHCDFNFNIFQDSKEVSIMVGHGIYRISSPIVVPSGCVLDIIGDKNIEDNELGLEARLIRRDVSVNPEASNIFEVVGGTLFVDCIAIQQESTHAESHGILVKLAGQVALTNCLGYAANGRCVIASDFSRVAMWNLKLKNASGGLLVTKNSTAYLENCSFNKSKCIGLELREMGFLFMVDTEINHGGGAYGLLAHDNALGFFAHKCTFISSSVLSAAGVAYISDSQFSGSGVVVSTGASCEITNSRISGCKVAIRCELEGSARIVDCEISKVRYGIVSHDKPSTVVIDSTNITARECDVLVSEGCELPILTGSRCPAVCVPDNSGAKAGKLKVINIAKFDKQQASSKWSDPRENVKPGGGCICRPGALPAFRTSGDDGQKPMRCSACKLVWYCSRDCQKKDWALHKPICVKAQAFLSMDFQKISASINQLIG